MSRDSVNQNAAVGPDKRFDREGEGDGNAVAPDSESRVKKIADALIPKQMAKAQLGRAFRRTVRGSDLRSKEFGDPGQVSRLGAGDFPDPIVEAWRREDTRRDLLRNLARESGLFVERFSLDEKTGTDD